jgi:hypothetical protein
MDDGTAALLFLYGLFWAEILATSARYKGFPTVTLWALWAHPDDRAKRLKRLTISVILLNLFPIGWLGLLYVWVVPRQSGVVPVVIAALASLSIFGIVRLYHGLVASRESMRKFYTEDELAKWDIHGGDDAHPKWAHLGPGILYLTLYPGVAWVCRYLL